MDVTFSDSVPMSALEPIIRDWFRRNDYTFDTNGPRDERAGGITTLSQMSGVSVRRIGSILAGGYRDDTDHVSFDTADRLLCAMCLNSLWHTDLAEWYGPIRVAGYEKNWEQPEVAA